MEKIDLPKEYLKVEKHYNHGWFLVFTLKDTWENGQNKTVSVKICDIFGTDYRRVFKPGNILKYYWWSLKQYLFWHNTQNQIGVFLRKHTKLNDTPDWG